MAQPMHCDYAGCSLLAEWITSRIDNGDTLAWCDEHYLFLCRSVVAQAVQWPAVHHRHHGDGDGRDAQCHRGGDDQQGS